jgi:Na+/proline symporter
VASKSALIARRSALLGGGIYLVLGAIPVLLGLVAREMLPPTEEFEQVLPLLSRHLLGELGFIILAGALVSAILSTVDSCLLACGALIVQNLVGQRANSLSDAGRLRLTRLSVTGLGLVAFVIATFGVSVHSLVEESGALGSAGLVVAGLFGLFTRVGGTRAALSSLLLGAVTYVLAEHVLELDVAYLTSLGGAALGYALGTLFETRTAAVAG